MSSLFKNLDWNINWSDVKEVVFGDTPIIDRLQDQYPIDIINGGNGGINPGGTFYTSNPNTNPPKESNTLLFVGIGSGVIVVMLILVLILKK